MKYKLANELLYIETNVRDINYCVYTPALANLFNGRAELGVRFNVKKDVKKPKNLDQKFDYYFGSQGAKKIYYEHTLLPGIKAKLLLDLSSNEYKITVNEAYHNYVRYRFENVWPPGQHFADLITIILLQNNNISLHCGAFYCQHDLKGYLVFGASNTGKSLTTFLSLNKGYDYHSEDITILDSKNYKIKTTPLISAQSDKIPNKSFRLRYNLLRHRLPIFNLLIPKFEALDDFMDFFENRDIYQDSNLHKIFILEKGTSQVIKLRPDQAKEKMLILNKLEFNYYHDHLFEAYSYFNREFKLNHIVERESSIIKGLSEKYQCYLVRSEKPVEYIELISTVIEQ